MKVWFKERMEGHLRDKEKKIPADFVVTAECCSLKALGGGEFEISGALSTRGDKPSLQPLEGRLKIDVLARKLIYDFRFGYGSLLRFTGEKNVEFSSPGRFLYTMTCLPGVVYYPDGKRKESALFRFNIKKDLIPLILSVRVQLIDLSGALEDANDIAVWLFEAVKWTIKERSNAHSEV